MKTKKMSLAKMQGKLSRDEMKIIMAGGFDDDSDEGDSPNVGWGTCCTPEGECVGPGCRQWVTCNYIFTKC